MTPAFFIILGVILVTTSLGSKKNGIEYPILNQKGMGNVMNETVNIENMNYFDFLGWLGIGSSHPGGFQSTKFTLATLEINTPDYVLDAGCGSGLTACHLAKTTGTKIVGIDINPLMIEKACLRAEQEGVAHLAQFKLADIYSLPFEDNLFDWVITESVTIFLDKFKAYSEIYRVLKPQGQVADLEMIKLKELPSDIETQMKDCFGADTEPLSIEEWCGILSKVGFIHVEIKNKRLLKTGFLGIDINKIKEDWLLLRDLRHKIINHPVILQRLKKNAVFIKKNRKFYGFGLFYGQKP